jgi:uncharacterized protein (TIGR02300 family)
MSKPARGTKRVCPSCGARFYDLNRSPVVCPVCQSAYHVNPAPTRRSERAAPVEVRKPVETEVEAPVLESADIISLEEAEESGSDVAIEDEEEIVDLSEDGAEIAAGDDDNTFLEEEEEGEADVSGIVGGGGKEEG